MLEEQDSVMQVGRNQCSLNGSVYQVTVMVGMGTTCGLNNTDLTDQGILTVGAAECPTCRLNEALDVPLFPRGCSQPPGAG